VSDISEYLSRPQGIESLILRVICRLLLVCFILNILILNIIHLFFRLFPPDIISVTPSEREVEIILFIPW
jgi:hypothetical protein